jgi:hypothetical protein
MQQMNFSSVSKKILVQKKKTHDVSHMTWASGITPLKQQNAVVKQVGHKRGYNIPTLTLPQFTSFKHAQKPLISTSAHSGNSSSNKQATTS